MYFLNIYIENSDEHEAQFDECFQDDNTTANSADSTCKPPPPKKRKLPKASAVSGEKKTRFEIPFTPEDYDTAGKE